MLKRVAFWLWALLMIAIWADIWRTKIIRDATKAEREHQQQGIERQVQWCRDNFLEYPRSAIYVGDYVVPCTVVVTSFETR